MTMKPNQNLTQHRIIDMRGYGILTFVQTSQEQIDWYMNAFSVEPDSKFGLGAGKAALLEYLENTVLMEDDFFNEDPQYQIEYPKRWENFLDDCVAFACLHSFMTANTLPVRSTQDFWKDAELIQVIFNQYEVANDPKFLTNGTKD